MSRRRILWTPVEGIDITRPISAEQVVTYCSDASNVYVYPDGIVRSRYPISGHGNYDTDETYDVELYGESRFALVNSKGVWRDYTQVFTRAMNHDARVAVWGERIFASDGDTFKVITEDDYVTNIGLFPPDDWDGPNEYNTSSFIGSLSWDSSTERLTSSLEAFGSTTEVGMYVYLYDAADEDYQYVGIISSLVSGYTIGIDTWVDSNSSSTTDIPETRGSLSGMQGYIQVQSIASYNLAPRQVINYKIRFKDEDTGTVSNTTTAENRVICPQVVTSITITDIPTTAADAGVDTVEIFRYDADVTTAQLYRKVGEVDIGTATFVDDHQFDGTEETWIEDKNYPPVGSGGGRIAFHSLVLYANRLWGVHENRVYYSEPFDGTASAFEYYGIAGLNYFEFDKWPKSLEPREQGIDVITGTEVWRLSGYDPTAMIRIRINPHIGCSDSKATTVYRGSTFVVDPDNRLYRVVGPSWEEASKVSALLQEEPGYSSFMRLVGSGDSLWLNSLETGAQLLRYNTQNNSLWKYDFDGAVNKGYNGTTIMYDEKLCLLDVEDGAQAVPNCSLTSPKLVLGSEDGHAGDINRVLVKGYIPDGTLKVYREGTDLEHEISFTSAESGVTNIHFTPVTGYYVVIELETVGEFWLDGPIVINPW